jgi:AraC family transcriptional regulator, regulatory protein of adaptative response / methylated-DNA-[protein]-cysteine methyltransferase
MSDYERIARIIHYLDTHHAEQPDLARLAAEAGLSTFHFHRLFSQWAGITPKDFLQSLSLAHVKRLLQEGASVLEAALAAGFSGPGRLHDLCVTLESASPGEMKSGGEGWRIVFGSTNTPFGECLLSEGPRGICHLAFVDGQDRHEAQAALREAWPRAELRRDDRVAAGLAADIFRRASVREKGPKLRAFVRGSAFQVRVWSALLRVPPGSLVTYGRLAAAIGQPSAARAVGSAVGSNPLAYLIPCHRVIRETGLIGEYRWGRLRKQAIIAWETSAGCP